MWWEPGGATRVTHWDPVSITCSTPGAAIYYRVDVNYEEAWVDDDSDARPHHVKWERYDGPFALPRPGLFEETICEGYRIKAIAIKPNASDSEVCQVMERPSTTANPAASAGARNMQPEAPGTIRRALVTKLTDETIGWLLSSPAHSPSPATLSVNLPRKDKDDGHQI